MENKNTTINPVAPKPVAQPAKPKTNFFASRGFTVGISFLGLFLITAGLSWLAFSYLTKNPTGLDSLSGVDEKRAKIAAAPKTEECPINGKLFSTIERDIWETRRPIAAMIENHEESRPLEGLHKADVVYEAVAEGGITRNLAIFYCGAAAEDVRIAPVRSARMHFINWAAAYSTPVFVHVGGANNFCGDCPGGVKYAGQVAKKVRAIEELADLGWRVPGGNDFDTTYDSGFPVFWRDYERLGHPIASEHTMVSSTDAITEEAIKRGFGFTDSEGNDWIDGFTPWLFTDGTASSSPTASTIKFGFWEGTPAYDVEWRWDAGTNTYARFNGGAEAADLASGEQFKAENVIVMFVKEEGPVDAEKHIYYETIGEGDALIFQNGEVIEGTWKKLAQDSSIKFLDASGQQVELVRGQIWIEAVPKGNEVEYN